MAEEILEFGARKPRVEYCLRPGSYGVLRDELGRIAVVVTSVGNFLPGGGQDSGESSEATLRREIREECGFAIRIGPLLGIADELVFAADCGTYFRKRGIFFTAAREPGPPSPTDAGHELRWLAPTEALVRLTHGSHRWAVERALAAV